MAGVLGWLARQAWRTLGRRPARQALRGVVVRRRGHGQRRRARRRTGTRGPRVTPHSSPAPPFRPSSPISPPVSSPAPAPPATSSRNTRVAWGCCPSSCTATSCHGWSSRRAPISTPACSWPGPRYRRPPSWSASPRRDRRIHDHHPVVVAAYPRGASWPPGPDLHAVRRRSRRVRRWASGAIAVAGVVDLLSAVTPPLAQPAPSRARGSAPGRHPGRRGTGGPGRHRAAGSGPGRPAGPAPGLGHLLGGPRTHPRAPPRARRRPRGVGAGGRRPRPAARLPGRVPRRLGPTLVAFRRPSRSWPGSSASP